MTLEKSVFQKRGFLKIYMHVSLGLLTEQVLEENKQLPLLFQRLQYCTLPIFPLSKTQIALFVTRGGL